MIAIAVTNNIKRIIVVLLSILLASTTMLLGTTKAHAEPTPWLYPGGGLYAQNYEHGFAIFDSFGRRCNFHIMFGTVLGTSYSKIRKTGQSHPCKVATRVHTSDSIPAGNTVETSGWNWIQSCAGNGACSPTTNFSSASYSIEFYNVGPWNEGPIFMYVNVAPGGYGDVSPYVDWQCECYW